MKCPVFSLISYNGNVDNTTNTYYGAYHNASNPVNSPGSQSVMVIPVACTAKNLYFAADTAPGTGSGWTATFRADTGGGLADTSLAASMTGASAVSASDTTDEVSLSAGDLIELSVQPSSNPTSTALAASYVLETTGNDVFIMCGSVVGGVPQGANNYGGISSSAITDTFSASNYAFYAPCSGTLSDLYVYLPTQPGPGESITATIAYSTNDGSTWNDSSITVTISGTGTTGSDTSNTYTVSTADLITMHVTSSAFSGAIEMAFGLIFTPDTPNYMPIQSAGIQDTSGTKKYAMGIAFGGYETDTAYASAIVPDRYTARLFQYQLGWDVTLDTPSGTVTAGIATSTTLGGTATDGAQSITFSSGDTPEDYEQDSTNTDPLTAGLLLLYHADMDNHAVPGSHGLSMVLEDLPPDPYYIIS